MNLNEVIRVMMRSEDDKIKQLESEVKRLKIALADVVLAKDVLETLVTHNVTGKVIEEALKKIGKELRQYKKKTITALPRSVCFLIPKIFLQHHFPRCIGVDFFVGNLLL